MADSTTPPTATRKRQATPPPTLPLDDDFSPSPEETAFATTEMLANCEQRVANLTATIRRLEAEREAATQAAQALMAERETERAKTESAAKRLDAFETAFGGEWLMPALEPPTRNTDYLGYTPDGKVALVHFDGAGSWREKSLAGIGQQRLNIIRYRKVPEAPGGVR